MSLNTRTVAKILLENFTGKKPIIKEMSERKAFLSSIIEAKLKKIDSVQIESHYSRRKF